MQFQEIIGQQKAKDAFFQAVAENRVPHALILKGKPGVGNLPFANAIVQYMNCDNPTERDSCGKCPNCHKIRKGIHPDVRFILPVVSKMVDSKQMISDDFFAEFREKFFAEPYFSFTDWVQIQGGENKQLGIRIREIRELKRKLSLKAFEAKYKAVIFWNAELINPEGSNALLKVLEEPPERTLLILTVSDPSKLLTTINSRCQRIQLHRISHDDMVGFLVKKHGLSEERAGQVSQISEGSITRAVDLVNETNRNLAELYQFWMRQSFAGDYGEIQKWVENISKESKEFQKMFLGYALQKIRDSLLFSFNMAEISLASPEERDFHQKFSKFIRLNGVDQIVRLLDESLMYLARNANSQMVFTVLSLRIHSLLSGKVLT
ncbi:MAG: DNA polymerase III subunit delta' [Bacteroidia bacterium]|nr:DNA polymerase III subunit delta' [Bacteroidia bacterium]